MLGDGGSGYLSTLRPAGHTLADLEKALLLFRISGGLVPSVHVASSQRSLLNVGGAARRVRTARRLRRRRLPRAISIGALSRECGVGRRHALRAQPPRAVRLAVGARPTLRRQDQNGASRLSSLVCGLQWRSSCVCGVFASLSGTGVASAEFSHVTSQTQISAQFPLVSSW